MAPFLASYTAPSNRPGVERNLIKAKIPINTVEGDLQSLSNAKKLVYNTLRKSLSDIMSKSWVSYLISCLHATKCRLRKAGSKETKIMKEFLYSVLK